jgi:MoxR-like ATPase
MEKDFDLYKELIKKDYICTEKFALSVLCCMNTKPTKGAILFGPAGTGKSFLPEVLSKIYGIEDDSFFFMQMFPGTREDDLIVKILPDENTKSGVKLFEGILVKAARSTSEGKKTFLVLDEWDKTRPSADSFLLDFLQTGRINYNGINIKAELDNLYIFITMNDERELSEPLLRRLPKIDFNYLSPKDVKAALMKTHREFIKLDAVVQVYEISLMAGLSKPATIQELRQLIDAVLLLNRKADWNWLIKEFITKTYDNHEAFLKSKIEFDRRKKKNVSESSYVLEFSDYKYEIDNLKLTSETIEEYKKENNIKFDLKPVTLNNPAKGGLLKNIKEAYNKVIMIDEIKPKDNPSYLGDFAVVTERGVEILKEIYLIDYYTIEHLWGLEGNIIFYHDNIKWEYVKNLQRFGLKFIKFTDEEIIGETHGVLLKWKDKFCEIVVDLTYRTSFERLMNIKGNPSMTGWLHVCADIHEIHLHESSDLFGVLIKQEAGIKEKEIEVVDEHYFDSSMIRTKRKKRR